MTPTPWWRRLLGKKGQPRLSRSEALGAYPVRNRLVDWECNEAGEAVLKVPRRDSGWIRWVARFFSLPRHREIVLDEVGTLLWTLCDGGKTVEEVVRLLCKRYRLNYRQGETSVTLYLKQLAERRLIAFAVRRQNDL
ncbi:MAG: PqqD family protein [Armatimonadetes bacterium]|nr:PqqD family protein [Armatimonadota bacterium]